MLRGAGQLAASVVGKALTVSAKFPELATHEHADAGQAGIGGQGQLPPGLLFADLTTLQWQHSLSAKE